MGSWYRIGEDALIFPGLTNDLHPNTYRTLNSIPNEVISFHPNLIAQSTDRYQVLKHAKGVAVITILREGLRSSESDGSGIVVLRLANGNWSPPAAVAVHVGGGWDNPEIGDAYDCLCVINEEKVNKGFDHSTCTFGDAVPSPTDGPLGGSLNDSRIDKPKSPVWMYIKAKGHWIEQAQLKGVSLEYRKSENESFYGSEGIQMKQILHGEVQPPTGPVSQLLKILKAVETGNHNSSNLPSYGKSPGDYSLKTPSK
jgi:lipid-binding SYLF domain-containing protein